MTSVVPSDLFTARAVSDVAAAAYAWGYAAGRKAALGELALNKVSAAEAATAIMARHELARKLNFRGGIVLTPDEGEALWSVLQRISDGEEGPTPSAGEAPVPGDGTTGQGVPSLDT